MWQVVWATLWAEVAPAPGLQGRAGGQLSLHEGQPAFCPLPPASPGEPSWPHVHLVSLPCSFCAPHVLRAYLPRDTEAWCVCGGGGWPRTQEAPRGGLWARPELAATPGGKDIPRLAEKPPLPPPTTTLPYPQLQRRRALGGGRGGGTEACRVSSLPPGTLRRAERAMALDSQAPAPAQPPHWLVSSISL